MMFLEKQSNLFLDTADNLARMARETLVRATLPNFHLPAAAEILTTGVTFLFFCLDFTGKVGRVDFILHIQFTI